MACKKSELVAAINSFGTARVTNDANLIQFAASLIGQLIETLEFEPEEDAVSDDELAAERADNV